MTKEQKAKEAVVKAAKACLNKNGFMFERNDYGYFPLKVESMRTLENMLARLSEIQKEKKRGT